MKTTSSLKSAFLALGIAISAPVFSGGEEIPPPLPPTGPVGFGTEGPPPLPGEGPPPLPERADWYFAVGLTQQGPFTEAEIARRIDTGAIVTETMVWVTGMKKWMKAGDTSKLEGYFKGADPEDAFEITLRGRKSKIGLGTGRAEIRAIFRRAFPRVRPTDDRDSLLDYRLVSAPPASGLPSGSANFRFVFGRAGKLTEVFMEGRFQRDCPQVSELVRWLNEEASESSAVSLDETTRTWQHGGWAFIHFDGIRPGGEPAYTMEIRPLAGLLVKDAEEEKPVSFAGNWEGEIETGDEDYEIELRLREFRGKIHGTIEIEDVGSSEALPIMEIRRVGNEISFTVPISGEVDDRSVRFHLRATRSRLEGHVASLSDATQQYPISLERD